MSRSFLLVTLLMTGIVLADETPEAEPAPAASREQAQEAQKPDQPTGEAQVKDEQGPEEPAGTGKDAKLISGMSILGNQEAPKSLVIVPWKSSVLGDSVGISTILDDSRQPIDKEVFMRALSYYEIRSGLK